MTTCLGKKRVSPCFFNRLRENKGGTSVQEVLNNDKNRDVITIAKEAIEEINSEGI